jgi:hypothetical protein
MLLVTKQRNTDRKNKIQADEVEAALRLDSGRVRNSRKSAKLSHGNINARAIFPAIIATAELSSNTSTGALVNSLQLKKMDVTLSLTYREG